MDPIKTGELIRALRMELGMTQQQLAQRLHVGDKAVSKWERGAGCPDVSLLLRLWRRLWVSAWTASWPGSWIPMHIREEI